MVIQSQVVHCMKFSSVMYIALCIISVYTTIFEIRIPMMVSDRKHKFSVEKNGIRKVRNVMIDKTFECVSLAIVAFVD